MSSFQIREKAGKKKYQNDKSALPINFLFNLQINFSFIEFVADNKSRSSAKQGE